VSTAFPVCVEVQVNYVAFLHIKQWKKLDFVLVLFSKLMIKLTAVKGEMVF
jgi:hypothetical protein